MEARRLVLWDVDGTLLSTGDIGAAVFDDALEHVLGRRPLDRVAMSGKTDPLIVREYLAAMAIEETEELVQEILLSLARLLAEAGDAGDLHVAGSAKPGVPEVLDRLSGHPGIIQTLLTGNVYANAVVKVTAYGLDKWLDLTIGAYGSDSDDRNELVPIALDRLESERGVRMAPSDVWVVGDTPRDLACARAAGAKCLLVATGRYALSELAGLGADAAIADMTGVESVVKLLSSG
jgi:phosphoglycolate phosphatase